MLVRAVLKCRDRDNVLVICNSDTWQNHIVAKHPEMKGGLAYVRAVLESPDQIYQDASHANERNFYRYGIMPDPYNQQYVRVGVRYEDKKLTGPRGYVITAFACQGVKKGEILRWSRWY